MTEDALPFAGVIARPLRVSRLLRKRRTTGPPRPRHPSPFGRQAPAPRPIGDWVRLDSSGEERCGARGPNKSALGTGRAREPAPLQG